MLSAVTQLSQKLGIRSSQSSQEQINIVVQLANREVKRSLSPVIKRKREAKLSPMSKGFKKTLHVNYMSL